MDRIRHMAIRTSILLIILTSACTTKRKTISVENQNQQNMNSYVAIFQIPATDIPRATKFYQDVLDIKLEEYEFPGMHMGLFPTENQMNVGLILKAEDYAPSTNGVIIYFNAGKDLQMALNKVEPNGGQIIVPKTPHADGIGFFALFLDTEGNKIGLHSPE